MGSLASEIEVAMHSSVRIRPINSILFISDPNGGSEPEPVRGRMILATRSCISFRCYPEQDGPTEVVLGDVREVDPGGQPAFDGDMETPSRGIIISTVDLKTVLQQDLPDTRTRIRIWLSHPQWPEKVVVGVG